MVTISRAHGYFFCFVLLIVTMIRVGRAPLAGVLSCVVWRGEHVEVGRYLGSTRNGVTDLRCDPQLGCIEAVLCGGRGPGVHQSLALFCFQFLADFFFRE